MSGAALRVSVNATQCDWLRSDLEQRGCRGTTVVMRLSPDSIPPRGVIGFDLQTPSGFTMVHDHAVDGPLWRRCVGVPIVCR